MTCRFLFNLMFPALFLPALYPVCAQVSAADYITIRGEVKDISVPVGTVFHPDEIFPEKAADFSDENFRGKYNITEPTESLEDAVSGLKKLQ